MGRYFAPSGHALPPKSEGLPYFALQGLSRSDTENIINQTAREQGWRLETSIPEIARQLALESQKPDCSDEVFLVYLQEFVLSRNLRRRHLRVGQKAAIVLDWSKQIELSPAPEKNKERGRPKRTLSEAVKHIGINEQRVFEVRQIR